MSVKITKDNVAAVLSTVQKLASQQVLVGIPEDKSERDQTAPIGNAAIGYIHEFGAPAANIPARAFLVPGIEEAKDKIAAAFKSGAKATLDGNTGAGLATLDTVGLICQSSARAKLNSGDFEPLSKVTLQLRYWAKGGVKITGRTVAYARTLVAKGLESYPGVSEKPLVVTGQLRNAITYVLRKK